MKEERRAHIRRNLFAEARILHPKTEIDCMLHNISAGGALASVGGAGQVPKAFILQIPANHEVRRRCVLAWRDGEWIGIGFVMPEKPRRTAAAAV